MSENYEERLRALELNDVSTRAKITSLEAQAVQKEHVRSMIEPVLTEQGQQGKRLDRLTDIVERQAETMEKQSSKIESILEDFHKSLLQQAEARQLLNILKTWAPLIGTGFLLVTAFFATAIFIYKVAPPGWFK